MSPGAHTKHLSCQPLSLCRDKSTGATKCNPCPPGYRSACAHAVVLWMRPFLGLVCMWCIQIQPHKFDAPRATPVRHPAARKALQAFAIPAGLAPMPLDLAWLNALSATGGLASCPGECQRGGATGYGVLCQLMIYLQGRHILQQACRAFSPPPSRGPLQGYQHWQENSL